MQEFSGGVFSKSLERGRDSASVKVRDTDVVARTKSGVEFSVPFGECRLEQGGASGKVLFCRTPDGAVTIHSEDPAFREELERRGGPALTDQFQQLAQRVSSRKTKLWLGISAAVGALMAAVFLVRLGTGLMLFVVPVGVDRAIGNQASEALDLSGRAIGDPVVAGAVESILERLQTGLGESDFEFRVTVIDSPLVNAFALPGGNMVVFTGLLREAEHPGQVAGVMAHEMAHVLERHGVERLTHSIGIMTLAGVLFGDATGFVAFGVDLARSAALMSYSRDQESEADSKGVQLMRRAQLDPIGLAEFFLVLADEQGDAPGGLAWFSSHPRLRDRAAVIRDQVAESGDGSYIRLAVPWRDVRRALADPDRNPSRF